MAYNVISCQKLLKTLKFWKSLNSLCKSGSWPQKSPKKAQKTDHSIAIYSNFWIGMVYFWVPPGESSCPDGSEYVWQRGVESLQGQVTAARSGPLFREEKKYLKRCLPKPFGYNFQNSALSLNQRYFVYIKIPLIQFQGWNMKIVAVRFFVTPF